MQEALRRRPLEKRHSKPCKFYQTMSCPLSADVCDFAHVLVDPASRFGINDTCRYYQSGYCANGSLCRYAHAAEVSPMFTDVIKISSPVVEQRSPAIYMSAPPAVGNGTPTLDLAFANLSISSCASPPSAKSRLFLNASYPTLPSPTTYPDLDDFAMYTEDPQMSEHSHAHQSRVYITDAISPVHVSPFPASLPHRRSSSSFSPLRPHFEIQSSLLMVESNIVDMQVPMKKHRSRGVSKKRLAKYKTKPCKFFFGHGICPNGDNCTFIHSENPEMLRRIYFSRAAHKRDERAPGENTGESALEANRGDDGQTSPADSSESHTPLLSPQLVINAHGAVVTNGGRNIKGRPRANSIPSTPSASSQMSMEYLFPAESPAIL